MIFNDLILKSIEKILIKNNAYLVGGYIRDYLISGKISPDRDIATSLNAEKLAHEISVFLDGTFVELDSENKIYRVVLKDKINFLDIAQALNNDIIQDAKRRDLTINSIFFDFKNNDFLDPLNGREDIENKILKTCSFDNLTDDPLRILRVYRFVSKTGFEIENKLNNFIIKNFNLVHDSAIERINYEIIKMFEGDYVVKTLLKMYDDCVLENIFPFVKEIKKIPPNTHHHLDLIHHSIETVNQIKTSDPLLKIAAFYHDIGKPSTWTIEPKGRHRFIGHDKAGGELVKCELNKLNFSNKQISYISKMVENHIYPASLINCSDEIKQKKKVFARFVRKMGTDTLDIINLSRADRLSARGEAVTDEMLSKALNHLDELEKFYLESKNIVQNPKSLLDGREIMEILNIKPSKKVGEIINLLIEAQIAGEINTKEEALDFVKKKGML